MSKATVKFVDCSTITTSEALPSFVKAGAKVRITTDKGEAVINVTSMGQGTRQAYAKGQGKLLQEGILKSASKANPLEGVLELVED